MFGRHRAQLRECPLCGSDGVTVWSAEVLKEGMRARVRLCCAECDTSRELVVTVWALDAYQRRHERQRRQIAEALQRAENERMDRLIADGSRRVRRPARRSP